MKEVNLTILENKKVGLDTYLMRLSGDVSEITRPGQFSELKLEHYYLRRPLSNHDVKENEISFLYKVLGQGTRSLTSYPVGTVIPTLVGLGNGFDTSKANRPLLIGGGIGIAPLYHLAKVLVKEGKKPLIILGFKNKDEVIYEEEFARFGKVYVTTDDGSYGYKGNPVSFLKENQLDFDYYYACGPQVMLKYLSLAYPNGEVSLEARMGCGFGACMGCSIETTTGPKRVCKEGPVFVSSEVKL